MEPRKNQKQSEAFIEAARELGCDEDESHFEEKLKKVARHKPKDDSTLPQPKPPKKSK
jgi:hypothetical protein